MKKLPTLFLIIVTALALLISFNGFLTKPDPLGQIFQILFIPITVFLLINLTSHLAHQTEVFDIQNILARIFSIYCLTISSVFIAAGFLASRTQNDYIGTLVFSPLAVFFIVLLFWRKSNVAIQSPVAATVNPPTRAPLDESRRDFLKLVGTAGVSIFLYNLIFRRNVGPLFSNTEANINPLSLKNAQGEVINPAEKSPTQGYYISQIDDSSSTSYFGFVNNLGQWFIMRQDVTNAYRYSRGDKDFTPNWTNRAELTYDNFDSVF